VYVAGFGAIAKQRGRVGVAGGCDQSGCTLVAIVAAAVG